MITERMIEAAAAKYVAARPKDLLTTERYASFVAGAQWAQQEFVKSLWHDASEEPKEHSDIVYIDDKGNVWSEYDYYADNYDDAIHKGWQSFVNSSITVTKWCYLNDILPEKGNKI